VSIPSFTPSLKNPCLLCTGALLVFACTLGCDRSDSGELHTSVQSERHGLEPASIKRIEQFCGDCHTLPDPTTFPKSRWPEEVFQGFNFYLDSERTDLEEPDRQDTVKYFQASAPDKIVVPCADEMVAPTAPIQFTLSEKYTAKFATPATAQVQWDTKSQSLFFTNMRTGELRQWFVHGGHRKGGDGVGGATNETKLIGIGRNLCRATPCDWNGDGVQDFLIGEMGKYAVADHEDGRVSLLLGKTDGSTEHKVLVDKVSRVVEAKPFDYDGDGDMDVLAADFGWRKTGALRLLRNVGGTADSPRMESVVLDPRHGALGIEIADMDGDSKLDFLVGYGQEFETLELHYNRGEGKFERKILLTLADPSYNASSFEIVDLDMDGRLDVVYTCGDTMDALLAKPYHGVGWVRNLGNDQWEHRWLGLLVGALDSTVADLDGDGDLDVAAVGMFPNAREERLGTFDSICWWEQKDGLNFVRHSVERDRCTYASCTTADIDGDGRLDLIVGEWLIPESSAFRVYLSHPSR